jgi:hypothetical protein
MNWEQWFCPNQTCVAGTWMVQRDPAICDVWEVAAHVADRPFTLAATVPTCPRCGTTLLAMVELEGELAEPFGAAMAPVFDVAC